MTSSNLSLCDSCLNPSKDGIGPCTCGTRSAPPPRIFAMPCPFNKQGVPVVGTFGSSVRSVIIIPIETWNRLCADIPQLGETQFEVGAPQ